MRTFWLPPTRFNLAFLSLICAMLLSANAHAQNNKASAANKATTPAQGSPERKAVLDAVRVRLMLKSQFRVYHLKLNGNWAYFYGAELMDAGEGELHETDLYVKVLLERKQIRGQPLWTVAELWTFPTDDKFPYNTFVMRARRRQKLSGTPANIFPADM